jgi:hypothetical protein
LNSHGFIFDLTSQDFGLSAGKNSRSLALLRTRTDSWNEQGQMLLWKWFLELTLAPMQT